jgi:hypothetical protein
MNSDEKNCPFCGELIKVVAIKCKHCKSDLVPNLTSVVDEKKSFHNENFNKADNFIEYKYELIPHGFIVSLILFILVGVFIQITVSLGIFESSTSSSTMTPSGRFAFNEIYNGIGWTFFYLLVNTLLCQLDFYNLRKCGIYLKLGFISTFIVPIYLYFRGTELNKIYSLGWGKSQLFFIAWIIVFIIMIPIEQYLLKLIVYS